MITNITDKVVIIHGPSDISKVELHNDRVWVTVSGGGCREVARLSDAAIAQIRNGIKIVIDASVAYDHAYDSGDNAWRT